MASDWLVFFKLKVVRELQVRKKDGSCTTVFFYFFQQGESVGEKSGNKRKEEEERINKRCIQRCIAWKGGEGGERVGLAQTHRSQSLNGRHIGRLQSSLCLYVSPFPSIS